MIHEISIGDETLTWSKCAVCGHTFILRVAGENKDMNRVLMEIMLFKKDVIQHSMECILS